MMLRIYNMFKSLAVDSAEYLDSARVILRELGPVLSVDAMQKVSLLNPDVYVPVAIYYNTTTMQYIICYLDTMMRPKESYANVILGAPRVTGCDGMNVSLNINEELSETRDELIKLTNKLKLGGVFHKLPSAIFKDGDDWIIEYLTEIRQSTLNLSSIIISKEDITKQYDKCIYYTSKYPLKWRLRR